MEIQLQVLLISPQEAGKWPASQPCRLNPREWAPGTNRTKGSVSRTARLDPTCEEGN